MPKPLREGSTSTAAAPSPNRIQVARSIGSMMVDILSPPMTRTFLHRPDSTKLAAVNRAEIKPEQAATRSMAKALVAPMREAT